MASTWVRRRLVLTPLWVRRVEGRWEGGSEGQEGWSEEWWMGSWRRRCWRTEVTGWGGRRSERRMTGKGERWRMWRRRERARGREGGTDSRGTVWSRSVAGTGREMGTSPLSSQMCKWCPRMLHVVVSPPPSQSFSGWSLVSDAGSQCDVSGPQSGSFSALGLSCACSWSAGWHTAETLHPAWWGEQEHWTDEGWPQEQCLQGVKTHRGEGFFAAERDFYEGFHTFYPVINCFIWLTFSLVLLLCPLLKILHSQVKNLCFLYFRILQTLSVRTVKRGKKQTFHHCKVMNPLNTCRGWMWFSLIWLTGSDVLFNSRLLSSARLWFIRSLRFFSTTGFSTWMELKLLSLTNLSQLFDQYFYTVKTIGYVFLSICVYKSLYVLSSSIKNTCKS